MHGELFEFSEHLQKIIRLREAQVSVVNEQGPDV